MRYLLEKATNFSDLRRVICFSEALKIDTAIACDKFLKPNENTQILTDADVQTLYNEQANKLVVQKPQLNSKSEFQKFARCA